MGLLDRLLGRTRDAQTFHGVPGQPGGTAPDVGEAPGKHGYAPGEGQEPAGVPAVPGYGASGAAAAPGRDPDEVAVERYRYLLRTAPPDAVEQAHAEAFARLSPPQRQRVFDELGSGLPPTERATADDPRALARMATRAEIRHPGTLEQAFRGTDDPGPVRDTGRHSGRDMGFGSAVGGSLLGTVAVVVIGSAVAGSLFGPAFGDPAQDFAADPGAGGADATGGGADPGAGAAERDGGGGFFGDGGFGDSGGVGDLGGF